MKFCSPLLAVKDIARARRFYEELLGLKLVSDYGKNIVFDCGLSLQADYAWYAQLPEDRVLTRSNNFELYFEEQDFDGFITKLKAYPGITLVHDVFEHGWGQRVIRFYDLDWHIIEVGEELSFVVRRFLAQGLSVAETAKRMDISEADVLTLLGQASV